MNPNGRKKGSVNRTTQQMRDLLLEAFGGEFSRIPEYMKTLAPKEKLDIITRVLPYLCPKLEAVTDTVKDDDDKVITINRTIIQGGGMGEMYGGLTPKDFMNHALAATVPIQPPNVTFTREDMSNGTEQPTN